MTEAPPFYGLNPTAEIYWNEFAGRWPIETLTIKQIKLPKFPKIKLPSLFTEHKNKFIILNKKKRKIKKIRSYKKYIYNKEKL